MHEHGPDELIGPVRGTASWWRGMGAQTNPSDQEPPVSEKTRKKRRTGSDPPIRKDLVDRVRREIAAGTYDTEEKWEVALDRLLDRLEKDD